MMEKFLYPKHPNRCVISRPSIVGKSVFLTNVVLKFIEDFDKIYFYSPCLHQDFYQKVIK